MRTLEKLAYYRLLFQETDPRGGVDAVIQENSNELYISWSIVHFLNDEPDDCWVQCATNF